MTDQKTGDAQEDGLLKSVRAAFSSWWSVLGVLAASVAGFSLLRDWLHTPLATVIAAILRSYKSVTHVPVIWLFQSMHWPRPPAWAIDAGVLWLLIGGVVFRSALVIRESLLSLGPAAYRSGPGPRPGIPALYFLMRPRLAFPLFLISCAVSWPVVAWSILNNPLMFQYNPKPEWIEWGDRPGIEVGRAYNPDSGIFLFLYDVRIVLATQAIVAAVCIITWFTLNYLLSRYV